MARSLSARCPICGKPASPTTRPFCCERCAQVDLGRWLTESYRVPSSAPDEADEASADEPADGRPDGREGHEAG